MEQSPAGDERQPEEVEVELVQQTELVERYMGYSLESELDLEGVVSSKSEEWWVFCAKQTDGPSIKG